MGTLWPVFVKLLSYPQCLTACLWLSLRILNGSKKKAVTMFVCIESLYSHFAACNESIQVFLSTRKHPAKHCYNTSAAGPSDIYKKYAKDSLQSYYLVLGLLMSTLSELTELLTVT